MFIKYSPFNFEVKKKPRKRTYLILFALFISGVLLFVFFPRTKNFHPSDTTITITNITNLDRLGYLEYGDVYKIAFSPDGDTLAVGLREKIILFDTKTGQQSFILEPATSRRENLLETLISSSWDELSSLSFSPNGKLLVSGSINVENPVDGRLVIWDVKSGKAKHVVSTRGGIIDLQFNYDGSILAYQKFDDTYGITMFLMDTQSGEQIRAIPYSASFTFSPTSDFLAYYVNEGIALLDISSGNESILPNSTINGSLAFSPDGIQLLIDSLDITALDINTNQISVLNTLPVSRPQYRISADTSILATGYSDWQPEGYRSFIRVWNYRENSDPYTLEGHDGRISTIAFSNNCEMLISGDVNGIVKIWNLEQKTLLKTLRMGNQIAEAIFSPSGNLLVVNTYEDGGGNAVEIWGISD